MKGLNRKKYKEVIRNFRKETYQAGITHKWIYFKDENNKKVLMYVYWSEVKRINQLPNSEWKLRDYNAFNYDGYKFNIILHGPSVYSGSLKVEISYISSFIINENCFFHIIEDDEVGKYYNLIFENCKESYRNWFIKRMR